MYYTEQQVERVLTAIGLDVESQTADDWIVFCPWHNNWRTPAGEVSKTLGTFYCFSCNASASLEMLVMKVSGRTYFEALRLIKSKEVASSIVDDLTVTLAKKPDFVPFDELLVARLHQAALASHRALDYFEFRKLTPSIKKFQLGFSVNQDMVTVPVHNAEGMLVGFVARGIEVKDFKNSAGLSKSKLLFNLNRIRSSPYVIVVESSFDAMRLDQVGIAAVATLGAGVSRRQIELLDQYFPHIFIVPDADEAGMAMKDKLVERLGSKVTTIPLPSSAKDVGDLSDDQLRKLAGVIDDPLAALI